MDTSPGLDPQRLTDDQLTAALKRLAQCERSATAALVAHLAEFDSRRLYRGAGFPSLFVYCTEALLLSGNAAYNRIEAARAARRYPVVLGFQARGSVGVTTLRLLAPHFTPANHAELLERASGKSRLQVEGLVAECFPRPPMAASVRKLPATRRLAAASSQVPDPASGTAAASGSAAATPHLPIHEAIAPMPEGPPAAMPIEPRRPVVAPVAVDRYKISFTASGDTLRKLRQAQELLRHQLPDGDVANVVDRALTALLDQLARRKFAATDNPRGAPATMKPGRHIPAAARRAVWLRDGGSCAFVAADGRRCGDRNFIEFHHLQPHAAGGPATESNIALRCRTHNGYEAERYFGPMRLVMPSPARASPQ